MPGWRHGNREGFCGRLRGCGRRMTLPREVVLDILTRSQGHLSAEEIYDKVRRKAPGIGLTTVYRTLHLLSEMDLVWRHDFGDGKARYQAVKESKHKDHHHHLVCMECRKVIDYTDYLEEEIAFIKKTQKSLGEKFNFEIKDHVVQFLGICPDCRK